MKFFVAIGAILGGLSVVTGAFGAHALEDILSEEELSTFQIGVRYQMFHALALIGVGLLASRQPGTLLNVSGGFFLFGVLVFSGSIYVLTLTGMKWLGMITPIGGVAFIVGWGLLSWHVLSGS